MILLHRIKWLGGGYHHTYFSVVQCMLYMYRAIEYRGVTYVDVEVDSNNTSRCLGLPSVNPVSSIFTVAVLELRSDYGG